MMHCGEIKNFFMEAINEKNKKNWTYYRPLGDSNTYKFVRGPNFVDSDVLLSTLKEWSKPFVWLITYSIVLKFL